MLICLFQQRMSFKDIFIIFQIIKKRLVNQTKQAIITNTKLANENQNIVMKSCQKKIQQK